MSAKKLRNKFLLDLHVVGICTVLKSSELSSFPLVVPIKSYNKQLRQSCSKCVIRFCWCNEFESFLFVKICWMLSFACLNKLHDNVNISNNWVSLNELVILRCLAKDLFTSDLVLEVELLLFVLFYLSFRNSIYFDPTYFIHLIYLID